MSRGFSRRDFLKTVVVSAGAVKAASILGCGGDGGGTPTPDAPPATQVSFPQSVASGDPRPDSIVLWTRAETSPAGDVTLTLEVATDAAFANLVTLTPNQIPANASADGCVRVKVTGLTAGTRYYYRFRRGTTVVSPVGRCKTAAAATADVQVRFAFLSCQDYIGRYYNTLVELLDAAHDDLDFVVHLGDYVYETTGDPQFQQGSGRRFTFTDQAGAEQLGSGQSVYYSAKSLSNYRQLYKVYRSDPTLQKVHEKFAFIDIWDDHEFTDDCWQDAINYSDGVKDEHDPERRRNSEQAFFEFQPIALDVETAGGALSLGRDALFPNTKLYRDFRFGKHLHLLLTDYRSFRPDHPIPEDGFPGKVVMTQDQTLAVLTADHNGDANAAQMELAMGLFANYINLDDAAFAAHKQALLLALQAAYLAGGAAAARANTLAAAAAQGNVDVKVLNAILPGMAVDPAGKPRGISYAAMGKSGLFGLLGSRYLVIKRTYDLWAAFRKAASAASDNAYGPTQSTWLAGRLDQNPDATWKVLADSVSLTSLILDLSPFGGVLPPSIPATAYYLNVDQWDGFPAGRKDLFAALRAKNAVIISGDIHAAYFTDYGADLDGNRIVELTGPGVSSGSFAQLLRNTAKGIQGVDETLVNIVVSSLDAFMPQAFPALKYANSDTNGVVVVTLDGTQLAGRCTMLAPDEVLTDQTGSAGLPAKFFRKTATVMKVAGKNGPAAVT